MQLTKAEIELILRTRDETSAGIQSARAQFGKLADDIQKKFSGGAFIKSILGGVGVGSGAQITQLLVDAFVKPFKDAAEAAQTMAKASADSLSHLKRMNALRNANLSDAERLARLDKEADSARTEFNRANATKFQTTTIGTDLYGLGRQQSITTEIPKTKEQEEKIIELRHALERAEEAALTLRLALQRQSVDTKLTDFFREVALGAQEAGEKVDTALTDTFREIELGSAERLQRVDAELQTFFDGVAQGAEQMTAAVDAALEDTFREIELGAKERMDAIELALGTFFSDIDNKRRTLLGDAKDQLVNDSIGNVSSGLANVIAGFQSVKEAAAGVWLNFKLAALQAFTDMVATYAVKKAAMFAIDVLFSAKGLALQAAQAAKSFAQWIGPAIAASIASYGTAAAVGAAAVAAVLIARNNFATGGAVHGPGTSTSDSIPIWASDGEYVLNARTVQRMGEANLDAVNYGRAPVSAVGLGGGAGSGSGRVQIALIDNRREADRFRRGSPIETQIEQVAHRGRYRLAG